MPIRLLTFGPSLTVAGAIYPLLRLSDSECLTNRADCMNYYGLG
ncbi:MAG: hypothetical protein WD768_06955 [Phycisphaeraceae bacterium]